MPEPNQTKWVGVRPTDPPESIPVTPGFGAGCTKVEPCAAGTEFKTLTKKRSPAISDLAAITDHCSVNWYANGQDCTVEKFISLYEVPAGEIWIVTNIVMRNDDSICDMEITIKDGVAIRPFRSWYNVPATHNMNWDGIVVLMPGDILRGYYRLGGATDDFRLFAQGWKIEEY